MSRCNDPEACRASTARLSAELLDLREVEESDRDRGEIIKRAMQALEAAGVPNKVERQPTEFSTSDDDDLEMLARRIRWLAARSR